MEEKLQAGFHCVKLKIGAIDFFKELDLIKRTRLAILKLLLEPVNLLILDEPTNHLDLKTKDVLKNLYKLTQRPKELCDKVFDRLFEEAEIAKFTPQEMREYEDRHQLSKAHQYP